MTASRSVKLFGTEEPAGVMTTLRAGTLEAELDAGNLRYIRTGGVEALRAIAFLVRDRNWGTYNPEITNLQIQQSEERFAVTYDAVCRDEAQSFRYAVRITGLADGGLTFEAETEALSDFETNRCGFVVLHALEGVVDHPVTVEHADGRLVESKFPALVDPACPFQDIRALTHGIAGGVQIACRMEGDVFEMEDHRNWMDASYKTYIRPLAKPWPYVIAKGEKAQQRVTMQVSGPAQAQAPAIGGAGGAAVTIGEATGAVMPRLGAAAPAEHTAESLQKIDLLRELGPSFLVCHFDARQGHGADEMRRYAELGAALGCELALEAVVPCTDASGAPTSDLAVLKRDIAAIRDAASGVIFARVAVSPASDLKCTLPGTVFPPAPSWPDLFAEAQAAFPGVVVGGGMFSYFTELNRKRPPAELLDFICHSSCPIVHAGDDVSVTETLEALPSVFRTVRSFAGGKPYWIFPSAVSMRLNPYGEAPAENPDNIRQAMNRVDPRDRALLGAAWRAGYLAHAARAGVDAVTLGAVAGPSGVVYSKQAYAQPWFDDGGAKVTPSFFVLSECARLSGGAVLKTDVDLGRDIQALAVQAPEGKRLLLANLTGEERLVRVAGAASKALARILDEESFEAACLRSSAMEPREVDLGGLVLRPYAVAMIDLG
ncbi:MAG: hypothetical protein KTR21_05735 [Rhodobacteraceae bacterium]|nr:hypothetical protein [Paracoccaceae bacterium]